VGTLGIVELQRAGQRFQHAEEAPFMSPRSRRV
jgi:hypothetical protein